MHLPSRVSHSKPPNSCDTSPTDEDYIDMDVNSTRFLCCSITSSPEFEFNMSLKDKDSLTSPADELFYKGKLLPLHLPPRIQMVQKLLQACNEERKSSPLSSKEVTPFESCNVTPSQSCHVSGELNPDEYFYDCPMNLLGVHSGSNDGNPPSSIKKASGKRLKLIKQSSLTSKLKASRDYFRSLFGKSDGAMSKREEVQHTHNSLVKVKDYLKNKYISRVGRSNPCVQIEKENRKASVTEEIVHRRSFSDAIKTLSTSGTNCKSMSFRSLLSSGVDTSSFSGYLLKRSSSVNADAVHGAIAYCKQSQLCSKTSMGEVGIFAFTAASRVAARGTQDKPTLYRG